MRVAINGFGRIGRLVLRRLLADDVEVVAINDLAPNEDLAYLFRFDSVHGRFGGRVETTDEELVVDGKKIPFLTVRNPAELPWKDLEVDLVLESTGVFTRREGMTKHLEAGAKRVLLSAPAKDPIDRTIVVGVNDDLLSPEDRLISNASCTTNCLAPMAKVLHDSFTIEGGLITTVHSYTGNQALVDGPSRKDLRRGRAAAVNVVPTSTGAARAIGTVIPDLDGRMNGIALRVPVPNGSIVDLVVRLESDPSEEEVNAAIRKAAEGPMKGVLEYSTEPLVLQDIVGNPHSCIFDSRLTMRLESGLYKVLGWYDNEWGFSNRVAELMERVASL